jgi:hypothetical protein
MHAAPAVRVRLERSWRWQALVVLVAAAAAGNVTAWALLHADASFLVPWVGLAAAAAGAFAVWQARRAQPPGALDWGGSRWQWQGLDGQATPTLDLDGWIMIRFDAARGGARWIAASRRRCVGPWHELRAALHAPRLTDPSLAPPA